MMTDYPDTKLFIDGSWRPGSAGRTLAVINPATEQQIGMVACAEIADLDAAIRAAAKGFETWRATSPLER
ncbi:MAG: aldehyde dehydrogenase family protein, partial [Rhodobacteraceae bacterium]|nr:aldehyde dehydrogenase family protein [Paracoccaceae bacterium]